MADDDPSDEVPADPSSAYQLGLKLRAAGQLTAAAAAFKQAMASPDPFARGTAALLLGGILESQRDLVGAADAYEVALAADHQQVAPAAAMALGMLRRGSGDLDGALAAFEIAVDSADQKFAGKAALAVGDILRTRGDQRNARAAFGKAVQVHEDAVSSARGRLALAELDYREGNREAAIRAMQSLAQSAPKPAAVAAAFSLGTHLARQGDLADARRAFEQVVQSGESPWVDYGKQALRQLRQH